MNRLDGKVALISGAARGIGGETARLMVEAGATVAIGDVLGERGRETAGALGDAALYVHLDVTREDDWTAAVAAAVGRFGKLDILVNNAGLFLGKDIEAASLAEWERLCAVNLTSPRPPASSGDARPALLDDQGRGNAVHKIGRAGIRP
jgi:NAD(P)-dependent dehydrogenase (short-subunit alcohol dehydrogenase family)